MTRPSLASLLSSIAVLALVGQAIPAFAQESTTEPVAETLAEVALPAITVSTVTRGVLQERIIASGLVAAVEEVQVQPQYSGEAIEELLADVGDMVTQGQPLARLSGSALDLRKSELMASRAQAEAAIAQSQANLLEAQANADEAERVARRNQALAEQGSVPTATAENTTALAATAAARVRVAEQGIVSSEANLKLVDAQLASLELNLARIEVQSPADGLIIARNATVGTVASSAGQAMFTIVRDGAMELRAEVSEQDLLRVRAGQTVSMISIGGAVPLSGVVRLIEPSIDTQTRLGTARIAIDDDTAVRAGMFMQAEILASEAEVLVVPVSAVGSGPSGTTVMRVRDGLVEQVSVTTGIRDAGMIEIVEGLVEGDQIVTRAAAFVRDGDRINPVLATGTTEAGSEG
jgi:HlyD family secretion protein